MLLNGSGTHRSLVVDVRTHLRGRIVGARARVSGRRSSVLKRHVHLVLVHGSELALNPTSIGKVANRREKRHDDLCELLTGNRIGIVDLGNVSKQQENTADTIGTDRSLDDIIGVAITQHVVHAPRSDDLLNQNLLGRSLGNTDTLQPESVLSTKRICH